MEEYKDIVKGIKFVIESCQRHEEGGTLLRKEIINIWSKFQYSLNNFSAELRSGYIGDKKQQQQQEIEEFINSDEKNELSKQNNSFH